MPLLQETLLAVGPRFEHCNSRSLVLERYADPTLKGDARRNFFNMAIAKRAQPQKRDAWREFLLTGLELKPNDLLFAQLQARLMVNMAGGVMENAGLCLDRLTGIPYIPGSAVKGCARRMAIQELYERAAGFQPVTGAEDATAKSQRLDQCAEQLVRIARVFGWGDQDWKSESDFEYACGKADWEEVRERAAKLLFASFPNWKADPKKLLWQSLPSFAGSISFLPSYPLDLGKTGKVDGLPLPVPELGKLELDVVTVHHREYYAGNPQYDAAPDTEEPVPVVFPAVAPGHVFAFAVLPGRLCDDGLLGAAKTWLRQGLETFGLGAKVAAGYGWFDASDELNRTLCDAITKAQATEQEKQRQKQEEAEQAARAEVERQKREAEKQALAAMTPDQQEDYKVSQLNDQQFDAKLLKFAKLPEAEAAAVVRALRGPRSAAWTKLKERGKKGQWAQVLQAVYAANKKLKLGKLP